MKLSEVELPSNRKFGFFFTAVFALLGGYCLFKNLGIPAFLFLMLAVIFLLVTLVNDDLLLPLNKFWMKLGLLLGLIISPIVMGIIFFGLFTPIAIAMKLFGRDELRLKFENRESYWKERNTPSSENDSFKYQF